MPASSDDYKKLVEVIRGSGNAEQKKIAAVTLTLQLLDSLAEGGTGDPVGIMTNGTFGTLANAVQNSIANY